MLGMVALLVVVVGWRQLLFPESRRSHTPTQQVANTLPVAQPVANGSSEGPNAAGNFKRLAGHLDWLCGNVSSRSKHRGFETGRVAAETARANERKPVEKPNPSARNADRMIAEDQPPQKPGNSNAGRRTVTYRNYRTHLYPRPMCPRT